MTLDEAIKRFTSNAEFERTHGNLQGCLEFRQLVKWLEDYKRLLEQEPILDKIRKEVQENINYNKKMNYQGIVAGLLLTLNIIDKYRNEVSG